MITDPAISRTDESARRLLFTRVVQLAELVDEIRVVTERLERPTEPISVVRPGVFGDAGAHTDPARASDDADVSDFAGGIVRFRLDGSGAHEAR